MRPKPLPVIGWREWLSLPEWGIDQIKAKIDTGARSSSLHALDLEIVERADEPWIRFSVLPRQRTRSGLIRMECPVFEFRTVRSSNGETSHRPVVIAHVSVGGQAWPIEITLVDRDAMGFRMLLGRTALRRRFFVDPSRSYLMGK